MNRLLRHRLLAIIVLAVLTSGVTVFALVQLLSTTTAQRVERARDAVEDEVERIAREGLADMDAPPTSFIGLRAGVETPASFAADTRGIPALYVGPIASALREATATHARVDAQTPLADGMLVVTAQPTPGGKIAFGAFHVVPSSGLRDWRHIVTVLTTLTVLLVAASVFSIVTASRSTNALKESLRRLASDLRAPVPRARLGELDAIAAGIEELATKLADARDKEVKLARELAQNERLTALGRVAAGVAHEVRNPLASIKLRLDLVLAGSFVLPAPTKDAIQHATSEIARLDRLVADLLVITGRHVGQKEKADLGVLVRSRVDGLGPWAKERSVRLEVSGQGTAPIDADRAARAIDNLVRNAIEASPANGLVRVSVEQEAERVVVNVEDEGVGVVNGAAELFEPFFTTKPTGTGLGLAISRAIARGHGGDVEYRRHDRTTSFMLSFTVSETSP